MSGTTQTNQDNTMKHTFLFVSMALMTCAIGGNEADGRGFGGFRGGGGGGGFSGFSGGRSDSFSGSRSSSFSGSRSGSGLDSFSGSHSSSFEGSRSSSYGGWDRSGSAEGSRSGSVSAGGGRAAGSSSYDRSYTGSRGGTASASGERGFAAGPNGAAAGSSRDVSATGANGRTYSSSSEKAAAVGPYGRAVGGSEGSRTATGARGTASSSWQSAFASGGRASSSGWQSAFAGGGHSSTDFGLAHYSSFGAASYHGGTVYHSSYETGAQAGFVRGTFGYYNAFHPAWYGTHPNCWTATRWAVGNPWTVATWPIVATYCAIPATPISYDYGNTVVIQDNSVNVNGQDVATPQEYAAQATTIADQGQKADPPPEAEWQPLGVFALVQGDATGSNNVFQLAVNKDGIIRGNYYDGLMDTTTQVYGSVDKKSQRAAWTIGKKNDRVFEAGISNLTKDHAPVLVHIGKDKTQQWMLVRVQQQKSGE
jgi:hypothetical protein